jgi:chorismate dehydratase
MCCGLQTIIISTGLYTMKKRISLVHYINSAPLGWAFLHGPFRGMFEVVSSSPALCAEQLSKGEVDIGLIPSIEYQRIPGLRIISDISISSSAKVRSILLVRPLGSKKIDSVAMDTSSRTSVALLQVLLHAKMGITPRLVPHPPNLSEMLAYCDAALLIGDAALQVRLNEYDTVDLAEEWVDWQQKPFVFAFWALRNDSAVPKDVEAIFREAKDWGLKAKREIAEAYAGPLDLPGSFLERYLSKNIDYSMGPEHIEGLNTFYHLARQENIVAEERQLRFFSDSKSARIGS